MSVDYHYSIGVDPGVKNLGFGLVMSTGVGQNIHLLHSETIDPSELGGIIETTQYIKKLCIEHIPEFDAGEISATIERYVPYNNVFTAEAENITMLVGALAQSFYWEFDAKPDLVRAIDWKMNLVKALFKWKNFNNPSDKLDKKFSIAAARACLFEGDKTEIGTDHVADAVCLASLKFIPDLRPN
jgi:hypothetical protein